VVLNALKGWLLHNLLGAGPLTSSERGLYIYIIHDIMGRGEGKEKHRKR
jgi:hypothetical protein